MDEAERGEEALRARAVGRGGQDARLDAVRAAEAKAVAAVDGGATESEKVRRIMAAVRVVEAG